MESARRMESAPPKGQLQPHGRKDLLGQGRAEGMLGRG